MLDPCTSSTYFQLKPWIKIILWASPLWMRAHTFGQTKEGAAALPVPAGMYKQIHFWELIFERYDSAQMLIHDLDEPDLVLDVIPTVRRGGRGDFHVKAYVDRYRRALTRWADWGDKAKRFGPMEVRVGQVYQARASSFQRLLSGRVQLRAQAGLADEFRQGLRRAQPFLPRMEALFRKQGLPEVLTRIAFVESMFHPDSLSKVGAKGLWQFMPETARQYLVLNDLVDERRSPFKATVAAARLLAGNYKVLQHWPLAITAYNHGRAGMVRAVRATGSTDLGHIVHTYRAKSFGFASRNFYAEFVAAARVYERLAAAQPRPTMKVPDIVRVRIDRPMSVAELLTATGMSAQSLRSHNPCLQERAFGRLRHKPLPKAYDLLLPARLGAQVLSRLQHRHGFDSARQGVL